jgi:hypothetical protein
MKQLLLLISFLVTSGALLAQENLLIVQGGPASGNGSASPTGYRIAAAWEFQPTGEWWTMGGSLGMVKLSASETILSATSTFDVTTIPICFVSRLTFGGEKFKGFVRGQLGTHISSISYSGSITAASESQWGMAAGISPGIMFWVSPKIFLGADYEWLWISNAFANSGSIGIASGSIGLKF